MNFDKKIKISSNHFINIAPQSKVENNQDWNKMEESFAKFFNDKAQKVYVITGVCLQQNPLKISQNNIAVPSCFYKIFAYFDSKFGRILVAGVTTKRSTTIKRKRIEKEKYTILDQRELLSSLDNQGPRDFNDMWDRIQSFENRDDGQMLSSKITEIKEKLELSVEEKNYLNTEIDKYYSP
jgi:hypothetical protein